jgi:hypothetical protein
MADLLPWTFLTVTVRTDVIESVTECAGERPER